MPDDFAILSRRAQLLRLRRLASRALSAWGLDVRRLDLLTYWENATYSVRARQGRFLLRVHRPGYRSAEQIEAELDWLTDLGASGLIAQRPRATPDGRRVVVGRDPGVPEPRLCTLLSWIDGRFFQKGVRPVHFARVGRALARLHLHASAWQPARWLRPRYDASDLFRRPIKPGVPFVDGLLTAAQWTDWERAAALLHGLMDDLGQAPAVYGPIHADLHFNNLVFQGDQAVAIDFDDGGWGYYACDISIPLSRAERARAPQACRDALLSAYAELRPLPDVGAIDAFSHLEVVLVTRWLADRLEMPEIRERAPKILEYCTERIQRWLERD